MVWHSSRGLINGLIKIPRNLKWKIIYSATSLSFYNKNNGQNIQHGSNGVLAWVDIWRYCICGLFETGFKCEECMSQLARAVGISFPSAVESGPVELSYFIGSLCVCPQWVLMKTTESQRRTTAILRPRPLPRPALAPQSARSTLTHVQVITTKLCCSEI